MFVGLFRDKKILSSVYLKSLFARLNPPRTTAFVFLRLLSVGYSCVRLGTAKFFSRFVVEGKIGLLGEFKKGKFP
jgi:hypothetical protein